MQITHIEVLDDKGMQHFVETGQLLKVIHQRETSGYMWVETHRGRLLRISKKTKRICGTETGFFRTCHQPLLNF